MFGDRFGFGFWHVGAFLGGVILTAALVVVAVLLVRYLIVATRAAQLYLDTHAPVSTAPPEATPPTVATKPAPRPRTPKTPPAT